MESIEKILPYSVQACDAEEFYSLNDQLNFNGSLNLLANIGENCYKISGELKDLYTEIDWLKIKGFRNRVVHDYMQAAVFMQHANRNFREVENRLLHE